MTLDLAEAKTVVASAIAYGLNYDVDSSQSSPPEVFVRTFREFDERVAAGDEVYAAWALTETYRPLPYENQIAEPTTLFAAHDLGAFVDLIERAGESRLFYELAAVPLLSADFVRCCAWTQTAQSKRLVALSVAAALHRLQGTTAVPNDDWVSLLMPLTDALRTRLATERCYLWWQIAALAKVLSPWRDWSALSAALWLQSANEIANAITELDVEPAVPAIPLARCPLLYALLAEIAERTHKRSSAAAQILANFAIRLNSEEWSMPQLNDQAEARVYLPACGWAIAHDVIEAHDAPWWAEALSERLPRYPSWEGDYDDNKRCALILLAACYAVRFLHAAAGAEAASLWLQVGAHADRWLPRWLWFHVSAHSPARILAIAVIANEIALRADAYDGDRIAKVFREIRDELAMRELFVEIGELKVLATSDLAVLGQILNERTAYERLLRPI